MADFDAIVIGAGNGGLTAAARLAKDGAKVLLLERHNVPGGCATSFCRGRFEFETSLHQLSGLGTAERPGPLRRMLQSLGVLDKLQFIEMDDLYRIRITSENIDITLKTDRNEVVSELSRRFPHEADAIQGYFDLVYSFFPEAIGAYYMGDPDATREKYPLYFKYALKSARSVMDEFFRDERLKFVLSPYWNFIGVPPESLSFTDMASMFVGYIEFKPCHLRGGSQALSNALAGAVLERGGAIRFGCGAKRILVDNGAVRGVLTDDGDEITTRAVISNASKISTYVDLMGKDDVPESARAELRQCSVAESAVVLYLGLDASPEELGFRESLNFIFHDIDVAGSYDRMRVIDIDEKDMLGATCYNYSDPEFAPAGASQVAMITLKYGDAWMNIPPHGYYDIKYRTAEGMLRSAERLYPGLRGRIEEMEVATPLTFMRYLGHPRGSIYGFDHHIKDSDIFIPNRPHIKGLYAAGGWVGLCGFQPTLQSGIMAAKQALRDMRS
jgi:prolycopene isomerase